MANDACGLEPVYTWLGPGTWDSFNGFGKGVKGIWIMACSMLISVSKLYGQSIAVVYITLPRWFRITVNPWITHVHHTYPRVST